MQERLTRFKQKYSELENYLMELKDQVAMNEQPAEGKWSVVQICEHLRLSEKATVGYILKKTQDKSKLVNHTFKSGLKLMTMKLAYLSPLKFKAPGDLPQPDNTKELGQVLTLWKDERKSMEKVFLGLDEDVLQLGIFRHPYLGRLNAKQTLVFMEDHFDRHAKQIKGILEKV
ncbi:MAG: DinB family protein [Flavobacteriales bacterium]|nr:DinB family protein [Flavobacteriales bacterium]